MKYFFDTYAIIELLQGSGRYEPFWNEEIITSHLNLGELYYHFLKKGEEQEGRRWFEKLKPIALTIEINIIIDAMKMKFKYKKRKLSFIDCVGYLTAEKMNLIFLTGDKEFENLPQVKFVK